MRAGPRAVKARSALGARGARVSPGLWLGRVPWPRRCAVWVGCGLRASITTREAGWWFWHRLLFNELWIHLAGWEIVIPHNFTVCGFLCDSPVRALHHRRCRYCLDTLAGGQSTAALWGLSIGWAGGERDEGCADLLYIHKSMHIIPIADN